MNPDTLTSGSGFFCAYDSGIDLIQTLSLNSQDVNRINLPVIIHSPYLCPHKQSSSIV